MRTPHSYNKDLGFLRRTITRSTLERLKTERTRCACTRLCYSAEVGLEAGICFKVKNIGKVRDAILGLALFT